MRNYSVRYRGGFGVGAVMYTEDEARSFLATLQAEEPNELRRIAKITTTIEVLN